MKICIIGVQNIKNMTLISLYTSFFQKNNVKYDLIYIDKYGILEETKAEKVYKFDGTKKLYQGKIGKFIKALSFKKYAINILEKNRYDFIVVWREQTAYMFANYLVTRYKDRYSINIRDLWNMKNIFMTNKIKYALQNSKFNTISSEGFLQNLPKNNYLMLHSANEEILKKYELKAEDKDQEPIVITYIGTIRFYEYCFQLIEFFSNDDRFKINFIGQGSDVIRKYVIKKEIRNVKCIDSFIPKDTMRLLEGTHIINCAFGSKNLAEQRLIPIRFYYALYKMIPVLTTQKTWLDTLANDLNMALSLPDNLIETKVTSEEIYRKYKSIDLNKMKEKIENYKLEIKKSHKELEKELKEVLTVKN